MRAEVRTCTSRWNRRRRTAVLTSAVVTALFVGAASSSAGSILQPSGTPMTTLAAGDPVVATVTTGDATDITSGSATFPGVVNPGGVQTSWSVQYGRQPIPTRATDARDVGAGTQPVSVGRSITGLIPLSTYYYRLVATTANGQAFGDTKSFQTPDGPSAPITYQPAVTATTSSSISLSVRTERRSTAAVGWVEYGTTSSLGSVTAEQALAAATGTDGQTTWTVDLTGLAPTTTYYYRVQARNSVGARGTDIYTTATSSVATGPAPVVGSASAGTVTGQGASVSASVDPGGLATQTHVEYGVAASFGSSTAARDIGSGSGAQTVSDTLSGLAPATTYYARVVAVNASGTAASATITFQTAAVVPSVTGASSSNPTTTGATISVTANGNGTASTALVEYGTTSGYGRQTAAQPFAGASPSALSFVVSGVTAGTYHYRVVATNSAGSSSTPDQTFATAPPAPVVGSASAGTVTGQGASVSASVDPGGLATQTHVEYGVAASLGSSTTAQDIGSGSGAQTVSDTLSGLAPATTYYARVVAVNASGTAASATITFQTAAVVPSVTGASSSNPTTTGATVLVTVNGNGAASSAFVEYGTTTGYGRQTAGQSVTGAVPTNLSFALSGLTSATVFHYRVVATNSAGTTRTTDQTFTTATAQSSNDLYVATTGSDSASGSISAPLQTLAKASSLARPGANVYIRGGSYSGFDVTTSGSSGAPITYKAYASEGVTITASGRDTTILMDGKHDLAFDHLTVTGSAAKERAGGFFILNASSNISISNSSITANGWYGINAYDSTNLAFRSNTISGNAVGIQLRDYNRFEGHQASATKIAGVTISGNQITNNNRMRVNTTSPSYDDTGAQGIVFNLTSGSVSVTGNTISGSTALSHDYGRDGAAFEVFGASNLTITGNTVTNNMTALEFGTQPSHATCVSRGIWCWADVNNGGVQPPMANIVFAHNIVSGGDDKTLVYKNDGNTADNPKSLGILIHGGTNIWIAYNTIDGMDNWAFLFDGSDVYCAPYSNVNVKDNIITSDGDQIYSVGSGIDISQLHIGSNVDWKYGSAGNFGRFSPYSGSILDFATFKAHAQGLAQTDRLVDPQTTRRFSWTNQSQAPDYHVLSTSPAINAAALLGGGMDGTWMGSAPDQGAYEIR